MVCAHLTKGLGERRQSGPRAFSPQGSYWELDLKSGNELPCRKKKLKSYEAVSVSGTNPPVGRLCGAVLESRRELPPLFRDSLPYVLLFSGKVQTVRFSVLRDYLTPVCIGDSGGTEMTSEDLGSLSNRREQLNPLFHSFPSAK